MFRDLLTAITVAVALGGVLCHLDVGKSQALCTGIDGACFGWTGGEGSPYPGTCCSVVIYALQIVETGTKDRASAGIQCGVLKDWDEAIGDCGSFIGTCGGAFSTIVC